MMDQERREKELQEIFEKIQHSYRSLVDNAFTLQEQTLELALTMFESSAQEKSPHIRGNLEELGLTRLREPIRVKRSGSVKGVEDGQDRQTVFA